jgi:hypothetical protein
VTRQYLVGIHDDKEVPLSRRTPSRARSGNAGEVNKDVSGVTVASTDPKLPIAAEFDPPTAAAELPPFEQQVQRRATK